MTTDPTADFDGCARECRKAGAHTLRWGGCEHATPPEPTVSMSKVFRDTDGCNSIGFDTYTVPQLAELIEPALRSINIRIGPNALAMLERGEEVRLSVGEYASMALAAADAVVNRNAAALAAAGVAPATDQTPCTGECDPTTGAYNHRPGCPDARPAADQTGLRDRIAAAIRQATCTGDCGQIEDECAKERIQPFALHHGRLAIVEATPEQIADAVLAVLPDQQAAIRAAALREAADQYAALADQNEAYELAKHGAIDHESRLQYEAVRDVAAGLRRMAAGAQQQPATVGEEQA